MAKPKTATKPTVQAAIDHFLTAVERQVAVGQKQESTLRTYREDLVKFCVAVGADTVLDDLEAEDLDAVFAKYRTGRSATTASKFCRCVSVLFSHADHERMIAVNPIPDCKSFVKQPRDTPDNREALDLETVKALLAQVTREGRVRSIVTLRDAVLIRLLVEVGPRVSELASANVGDMRRKDGRMWLFITGKGNKKRPVPLTKRTLEVLARYIEARGPNLPKDAPLFIGKYGNRMTVRDIEKRVAKHGKAIGLEQLVPHTLRHTAGTLVLANNESALTEARDLLGHENIATTSGYLSSDAARMHEAVEKYGELF